MLGSDELAHSNWPIAFEAGDVSVAGRSRARTLSARGEEPLSLVGCCCVEKSCLLYHGT